MCFVFYEAIINHLSYVIPSLCIIRFDEKSIYALFLQKKICQFNKFVVLNLFF